MKEMPKHKADSKVGEWRKQNNNSWNGICKAAKWWFSPSHLEKPSKCIAYSPSQASFPLWAWEEEEGQIYCLSLPFPPPLGYLMQTICRAYDFEGTLHFALEQPSYSYANGWGCFWYVELLLSKWKISFSCFMKCCGVGTPVKPRQEGRCLFCVLFVYSYSVICEVQGDCNKVSIWKNSS